MANISRIALIMMMAGSLNIVHRPASAAEPGQAPQAQDNRDRDRDRRPQDAPRDYEPVSLPEGTVIPVRMSDEVNSNHDKPGTMFTGTVDPSVLIHDAVVIPRGTEAHIRLIDAKKGGHFHGKAKVRLELTSLILNGQRLRVESNTPGREKGAASAKASAIGKKSAATGGVPAAAAEGATSMGATTAAGPVIAAFTAAKVEVKPGSRIEFRLEEPFTFEKPPVNNSSENR